METTNIKSRLHHFPKKIIFIFLTLAIQITSCQNVKQDNVNSSENSKQIDFLNYPVDDVEGIATEGHMGVFRNFDFNYINGEAFFILIPKEGAEKWYVRETAKYKGKDYEIDSQICTDLGKKGFKKLSDEFNIWVIFTDLKYLQNTPKMDSPYSPKIPRKEVVYFLQDDIKKWKAIDSLEIKNEKDEEKENKWRENFIDKIVKKSNENKTAQINQSLNKVLPQWYGNYEGSFLRMKEESADPRSWATINLKLSKDSTSFYLFSYIEEKNFKLKLIKVEKESITFDMENNSTIKMNNTKNKWTLESTYINNLIGEKKIIELTKK